MLNGLDLQTVGVIVGIVGGAWAATWGAVRAVVWVTALVSSIKRAHERLDAHEDTCGERWTEVKGELEGVKSTIEEHRKEAKLDSEHTRKELGARIGDLTKAILGGR